MVLANGAQAAPGVLSVAVEGMSSPQAAPTVSIGATDPDNEDVPMIDKAQAVERLKQARKRRAQQLKKWNQYEKQLEKDAQKKKKLLAASQQLDSDAPASRSRRIMFSQNLLLLEAASRGDLDEVATLLAHGISPDSANEDGLTALHQCCIDDNEPMCRLLLQYHAKVDAVDSELWTPLHAAATCGHANICKVLIDNGANLVAVNGDGNMAYDICEDEYTLSYIESEMAKRGITQEQIDDMRGERERQTLAELKQWVADGGDVDVTVDTRSGATILHVAAANGWLMVCEYALSQGATVDVEDRDGWQPIHVAACWGYVDEVQMLAEYGADTEVRTRGGESILELCEDEELRRRLSEIKSNTERRPRVTRARASPKIQNNHHLAAATPSVTLTNGADVAAKQDTSANLTVANAPPASPNLGSRNNGSVRMRTSFSHGSPSTNGNAIGNTNRNSIRRSSLRRSSMRQKSMMSQREAEADGELRQQAAEALAVANGRGPIIADADSVDDLDSDPSAQNRGMSSGGGAGNQTSDVSLSIRRNDPLTSSQNKIASANISSQAVAYSAEKYARPNSPAQVDDTSRTTLSVNASESAAMSNSRTATPQPPNSSNNNEKKSVLKNTGGTTSTQANVGAESNNADNANQRKAQKSKRKGCCVIS